MTDQTLRDWLAEMRALCDAATDGPWIYSFENAMPDGREGETDSHNPGPGAALADSPTAEPSGETRYTIADCIALLDGKPLDVIAAYAKLRGLDNRAAFRELRMML